MLKVKGCGAVQINVGTLRRQMHLQQSCTRFSTLVGLQPWSDDPLVYLLDRTQFIDACGSMYDSKSCRACFRGFGLGSVAPKATFSCRSHAIGKWEPRRVGAVVRVQSFAQIARDPTDVTAMRLHPQHVLSVSRWARQAAKAGGHVVKPS